MNRATVSELRPKSVFGSLTDMTAIPHTSGGEVFSEAARETYRLAWRHRREAELDPQRRLTLWSGTRSRRWPSLLRATGSE